jgi:hypothetical protein
MKGRIILVGAYIFLQSNAVAAAIITLDPSSQVVPPGVLTTVNIKISGLGRGYISFARSIRLHCVVRPAVVVV